MSSRNTLEIRGTRSRINELLAHNPEITDALVYAKPSKRILFSMLNAFPNLKRVVLGKGIMRQMPKRQVDALEKVGIAVIAETRKRGRAPMFSEQQKQGIIADFAKDRSSAKKHGVSARSVYYWMKK
jgi:hypothetical protein